MGIFFMGWKLIKIIKILREILKNVIKINYNNTHIEVVLLKKVIYTYKTICYIHQ